MTLQRVHLRRSLRHMVDFAISGRPDMRMRQLARMHSASGKDIDPSLYQVWLDSLVRTIGDCDDGFDTSVEMAWRAMMKPGIAYMRRQYRPRPAARMLQPDSDADREEGIARWLDHWAARAPQRIALQSPERTLTYGELADESARLASGLKSRAAVEAGDRVAYLGSNRVEFIVLVFACARLGSVVVPLNSRLVGGELSRLLARVEPKALLTEPAFDELLPSLPSGCQRVLLDKATASPHLAYDELIRVPGAMRVNDGTMRTALLIVFTSGSTGDPKGAVLTQGAVHWNAMNSQIMHDMTRNDHIATTLPFFHVGGINIQTLPAFQVGARVTILPRFDARSFIEFTAAQRPTLSVLVPAQMQALMQEPDWETADLSSLRAVATGSTIVSSELIADWANRGIPVIQVYGCTESGPIAAHQTVEGIGPGWGTVGHPAFYTDVMVADDDARPLTTGAEGEILIRGPNIAECYWRDDDATRATFRHGWLHTGDLGYFDANGASQRRRSQEAPDHFRR